MLFKPYAATPITRQAFQITNDHQLSKVGESTYRIEGAPELTQAVLFKAYQQPLVGDWVVRLTEEDTYHVADAVFRERNVVPD